MMKFVWPVVLVIAGLVGGSGLGYRFGWDAGYGFGRYRGPEEVALSVEADRAYDAWDRRAFDVELIYVDDTSDPLKALAAKAIAGGQAYAKGWYCARYAEYRDAGQTAETAAEEADRWTVARAADHKKDVLDSVQIVLDKQYEFDARARDTLWSVRRLQTAVADCEKAVAAMRLSSLKEQDLGTVGVGVGTPTAELLDLATEIPRPDPGQAPE